MQNNKYVKLHSLLRMFAALLAIVVFVSMFSARQVEYPDVDGVIYDFRNGFFFGDGSAKGNWIAFIGYFLVLIGGLAGLAFVFIDEIIGKDLTKKLSFVAGAVALVGGIAIVLSGVIFRAFNSDNYVIKEYVTCAAPIVFGILAILVGGIGICAPILEDKGY